MLGSIRPHSSAHPGGAVHCQIGLASGRSLGAYWRCRLGRPRARWTDQLRLDPRHWICPCEPLETGCSAGPWWRDATRPGLATRWRRRRVILYWYCSTVYIVQSFCSGTFKNVQLKWFQLLCVLLTPMYNISNVLKNPSGETCYML